MSFDESTFQRILQVLQSWMTIKKTEISAQHEFLKPKFLCLLYAYIELLYSHI